MLSPQTLPWAPEAAGAPTGARAELATDPERAAEHVAMINLHELAEAFTLDGDSDDDARVSLGSAEETGVPGCNLEFEQTRSALGVTGRETTQTVPEFVQRLLAAELKEWALAQGALLSQGVHTVQGDIGIALQDYAARLEVLGRLPCRVDAAAPNHSDRPQEPCTGREQRPPRRREDTRRKKPCGRAPLPRVERTDVMGYHASGIPRGYHAAHDPAHSPRGTTQGRAAHRKRSATAPRRPRSGARSTTWLALG